MNGQTSSRKQCSMKHLLKFSIWTLPFLGLALGCVYAYLLFHGLREIWHRAGGPEEHIVQIIDVTDAGQLFVTTETGKTFSLGFTFTDGEKMSLSFPMVWNREDHVSGEPMHPIQYYGADFFTLPPLYNTPKGQSAFDPRHWSLD